jgi:hypothetical protein
MELSSEDSLRLNVLLSSQAQAIRIDESAMTVHGLAARGEMTIRLNPNCRADQYLRRVRELLSGHVLGSPGGYPVFLQRWTRMGQARGESLGQLLLLGQPEAVVAVVHAAGLTPELARLAWWAMPEPANARRMLENPEVADSAIGKELANYLLEYMPFEEDAAVLVESARRILQPGLISEEARQQLWQRGFTKTAYHLGFLWACPDTLPSPLAERGDAAGLRDKLGAAAQGGNPAALLALWMVSAQGQTMLDTARRIMEKPANQEIVNQILEVLASYFSCMRLPGQQEADIETLRQQALAENTVEGVAELLCLAPQLRLSLRAMQVLGGLSYAVVRPVFSRSDAVGSQMRRKLEPVFKPLLEELAVLRGEAA